MYTDRRKEIVNESKLIHRDQTYAIIGSAIEVLNALGHGFNEKPYENALVVEFKEKKLPFTQQPTYELTYKDEVVGKYIPDLIAFDSILIDTKVIEKITDRERGQMLNFLRVTRKRVGLLLNFNKPKLEWERIVL